MDIAIILVVFGSLLWVIEDNIEYLDLEYSCFNIGVFEIKDNK